MQVLRSLSSNIHSTRVEFSRMHVFHVWILAHPLSSMYVVSWEDNISETALTRLPYWNLGITEHNALEPDSMLVYVSIIAGGSRILTLFCYTRSVLIWPEVLLRWWDKRPSVSQFRNKFGQGTGSSGKSLRISNRIYRILCVILLTSPLPIYISKRRWQVVPMCRVRLDVGQMGSGPKVTWHPWCDQTLRRSIGST